MGNGNSLEFTVGTNIFVYDDYTIRNKLNSIYQAKHYAIKNAIGWFKNSNCITFMITTDSQSSLAALNLVFVRNYILKNKYKTLITFPKKHICIS